MIHRCPRCGSPFLEKTQSAVQFEGEVQECPHSWHTKMIDKIRPVYAHQISTWAKTEKGIELTPFQIELLDLFLAGHNVITARQIGRTTVLNLIRDYFEEHNG